MLSPMTWRSSLIGLIVAPFLSMASYAEGDRHALIIGVSDYWSLPSRESGAVGTALDLNGPKNDVMEMIRLALELGVSRQNLTVLADGVDSPVVEVAGLPTRRRILAELDRLTQRVKPKDQILLYYSGHGSQQPDQDSVETGQDEADGKDEILLPIDIGVWSDDDKTVENAIIDDELGARVAALRRRGASVWVIIDACHSGTMLRGRPVKKRADLEIRALSPAALGIPPQAFSYSGTTRSAGSDLAGSAAAPVGTQDTQDIGGGQVIAFYAATAAETAIGSRWRRPDGSLTPTMGLLTFTIREALSAGRVRSYHDLALRVAASFDIESDAPIPAFEGSLNHAIFGFDEVPPIRWPVARRRGQLVIDAGILDGIREGSIIEVASASSSAGEALAYLRVQAPSATSATLAPVAYGELPGSSVDKLNRFDPYIGTVVESGVPISVKVARPRPDEGSSSMNKTLREALDRIEGQMEKASDLLVEWVEHDQPADLYLISGQDRIWLSETRRSPSSKDRDQPPWITVDEQLSASQLAERLTHRLAAFARSRALLRVMGELEIGQAQRAADVRLYLDQRSSDNNAGTKSEDEPCPSPTNLSHSIPSDAIPLAGGSESLNPTIPLRHCDVVYARVENVSRRPVDMTPLYFDREGNITYLESGRRQGIRVMPERNRTFLIQINTYDHARERPYPIGVEQLVVLTVSQPSNEVPIKDYSYLARRSEPPSRSSGATSRLDEIIDAAGFGVGLRGEPLSVSSGDAAVVRFGLTVVAD